MLNLKRVILAVALVTAAFGQSAGVTNVTVNFNSGSPAFTTTAAVTNFDLTLTGNATATFSSAAVGVGSINVCQDGTGSRTLAWPGSFVGFPTISSTASSCTRVYWKYDGTNVTAIIAPSSITGGTCTNSPVTAISTNGVPTCSGVTVTNNSGAVLTIAASKTATVSNTLTFTGTDGSTVAFGAGGTPGYIVATGTLTLGTSAIAANSCASPVTQTATGAVSTDRFYIEETADWSSLTGYGIAATDGLAVYRVPITTNTVGVKVCNLTGASITPSAASLRYAVWR